MCIRLVRGRNFHFHGQKFHRSLLAGVKVVPHLGNVARLEQDPHEVRVGVLEGVLALVEDEQALDTASLRELR